MKKIAVLFPGQGSQFIGMGKDNTDLFFQADAILNYKLSHICFEGPEELLSLTENTQPAILTHSISSFQKLHTFLKLHDFEISYVLGHSVGEYAALVAAGAISFPQALKTVHLRGKYMQAAVPAGVGAMYAILKLDSEWILKACKAVSTEEAVVMPANFNDPKQIVISGHKIACENAIKWLEENCPHRFGAIALKVSAPFHCSLMKPAELNLKQTLDNLELSSLNIPYVANVDAKIYSPKDTTSELIKDNLTRQICASVLWTQSLERVSDVTHFIEVSPGKILSGLTKRTLPNAKIISMDQLNHLNDLLEFLK